MNPIPVIKTFVRNNVFGLALTVGDFFLNVFRDMWSRKHERDHFFF